MNNQKIKIHPYIEKALQDPVVKGNINKFKKVPKKIKFFAELIRTRHIIDGATYEDVLELIRDASLYTVNISVDKIKESINFFNYKPDPKDMKRQKYDVYVAPRIKD